MSNRPDRHGLFLIIDFIQEAVGTLPQSIARPVGQLFGAEWARFGRQPSYPLHDTSHVLVREAGEVFLGDASVDGKLIACHLP